MHTTYPPTTNLHEFYERAVLPELFERLDRAFPEFQWMRSVEGWTGVRFVQNGSPETVHGTTVWCKQPWGFVDASGQSTSWLSYVSGRRELSGHDFSVAVQKLANLAELDNGFTPQTFTADQQLDAQHSQRQCELLESFIGYCHGQLCGESGRMALEYLRRAHGIDGRQASDLPIGLYTTHGEVRDHLRSLGFSEEEITESKVLRDLRLDGRIILPWRDRYGTIRTLIGYDASASISGRPRRLYRRRGESPDPFGLDFAMRATSGGRDHLILVEEFLNVVYLQEHGLPNCVTFGPPGKLPTSQQWEQLSESEVSQVTLAFADDPSGWERTLAALHNAYQARRAPQIYVIAPKSLETARGAATFARLQGVAKLRDVLRQRLHGFHFVARALVEMHKGGEEWTDPALVATLHAAMEFDAKVYRPERTLELERFFWPPILEATGANWETLRLALRREPRPTEFARREVRPVAPPPPAPTVPVRSRPKVEVRRDHPQRFWANRRRPVEPPRGGIAVLPIDVEKLAYSIWERKGRPEGRQQECWLEAEALAREHYAAQSVLAKSA